MTTSFNPYHEWLGVAPRHNPPNYFQLLRVHPRTTSEDAFLRAVEDGKRRCLEQLARVPPGVRDAAARKLRQEIELAADVLSDPEQRANYVQAIGGASETDAPMRQEVVEAAERADPLNQPKPESKDRLEPRQTQPAAPVPFAKAVAPRTASAAAAVAARHPSEAPPEVPKRKKFSTQRWADWIAKLLLLLVLAGGLLSIYLNWSALRSLFE